MKNNMNILVISNYPNSLKSPKQYTFIKNRVDAIKNIYNVTVLTINIIDNPIEEIEIVQADGYRIIKLNIKKRRIPKFRVIYYEYKIKKLIKEILKKNHYDLIHIHFSSYYSWIINNLSKKYSIPYYITEHASFFEDKMNSVLYKYRIKKALVNAEKLVTVSSFLKKKMINYIDEKIDIIPNIVNIENFYINNFNCNSKPSYTNIITVGNLTKNDVKGYERLITSLKKINDLGLNFKLKIIGDGPKLKKLKTLVNNLELNEYISFLGKISNDILVDYYNKANFFISSSKIETFGLVIIEAMSCGLPVLATRSGGPEDIINDKVGLLVDNDQRSLTKGIKYMLKNYDKFDKDTIRKYIVKNYSIDTYKNKIKKIYN